MEETAKPVRDISRRTMLKRAGVGAAVVWSAPILSSVRVPAFARTATGPGGCPKNPCDSCDVNTPCNSAFDCQNSGGACNCWVLADRSSCYCGPISACTGFQPCQNGQCPAGQCCVENCCGQLCYPVCSAKHATPYRGKAATGVRR